MQALFEGTDFPEPLVFPGFGQTLLGVFGHDFDPAGLGRVHLKEAAFDAGVFMHAGSRVGAVAGPECDSAKEEVWFEFLPFIG